MRRLTIALALLAATAVIAACSASAPPGWTYAPAPSATPIPSGASGSPAASGSAAPSVAPSAAPSAEASSGASPSAGASGGAGSLTVTAPVGASGTGFDPTTLETAANAPFTLTFDNQDTGVMHNLVLKNPDGSKVAETGDTKFFAGPGQRSYGIPALAAGTYSYLCEVHPTTMTGTLTVK